MRLVLHPSGLLRLKTDEKPARATDATKHAGVSAAAEDYEVTPYGRRPRRRGWARTKTAATVVAVMGAAGAAVWMLV